MDTGLVYFITDETDEYVKIGWVKFDVYKRLLELQTGNPRDLRLLAYRRGSLQDEANLHQKYKYLHVRGEWFLLQDSLWSEMGRPDTRGFDARIHCQPPWKPHTKIQNTKIQEAAKARRREADLVAAGLELYARNKPLTPEERTKELALIEKILAS